MQSISWTPEHSGALREYLAKGMSYSAIRDAINAKFKTAYSRNAAIGRAKRMGLAGPDRPADLPKPCPKQGQPRLHRIRERQAADPWWMVPIFERTETAKLRCVEIDPRHISLLDLELGDCRYPYGGDEDGEAITFCGHPQRQGSSYCGGAFSSDARPRHGRGTGCRHRLAVARGGGMKRGPKLTLAQRPAPWMPLYVGAYLGDTGHLSPSPQE